jgi:hypothetical protein
MPRTEHHYVELRAHHDTAVSDTLRLMKTARFYPRSGPVREILDSLEEQNLFVLAGNALTIRLSPDTLLTVASELEQFLKRFVLRTEIEFPSFSTEFPSFSEDLEFMTQSIMEGMGVTPDMLNLEAATRSQPPDHSVLLDLLKTKPVMRERSVEDVRREFGRQDMVRERVMQSLHKKPEERPAEKAVTVVAEFERKLEI